MMAPVSEEEENFLRLALLLKGVAPRAVRTYFDSNFPPTYLPSTLNTHHGTLDDLKFKQVLTQSQWNLLFPTNGVPDSVNFDVTLMICLIRIMTCFPKPINGYNRLPLPHETTPGADLARIKWYRNNLAHDSNKIVTADFNTAWSNISDAVSRLGGLQMKQECQELKVKILDQSNQEIMLEIKQAQEEIKELKQTMATSSNEHTENLRTLQTAHTEMTRNLRTLQVSHSTLQTEHTEVTENLRTLQVSYSTLQTEHTDVTENLRTLQVSHSILQTDNSEVTGNLRTLQDSHSTLQTGLTEVTGNLMTLQVSHSALQTEHMEVKELLKDPIPSNIRGQIKEELESWTEDDKKFIETNGARSVLKCIEENGCVVVTGSPGIGKSSLVRHIALQMQERGYDILPLTNPKEIIKWYSPNKNILFVVDDFCGTYTINPMKLESWKNLMEKIKRLIEKKQVRLIMSCRLQVYKDEKLKSASFYQCCECNLLSEDLRLSKKEKQSIAEQYIINLQNALFLHHCPENTHKL